MSALTPDDLRWLACPACQGSLTFEPHRSVIRCNSCSRLYPIVDGLPVLLEKHILDHY